MVEGDFELCYFTLLYFTSSFMSLSVSLTPCVVVLVVLLPCLGVDCALVFSSSTSDSLEIVVSSSASNSLDW
jgi:hypothetical protein